MVPIKIGNANRAICEGDKACIGVRRRREERVNQT